MKKINISMSEELVKRLDDLAKEYYSTRSGIISAACSQFAQQKELLRYVRTLSVAMERIAKTGTIDSETQKQLDQLRTVADFFINSQT